jgi:sugar phosphate isomerase/epimerase
MAEIGLQLYSAWEELARDFHGTLRRIASMGFAQVEYFGGLNRQAAEVRQALEAAGLRCPSAHWPMAELVEDFEARLECARELRVRYLVCAMPWVRDASQLRADPAAGPFAMVFQAIAALTLDDWKWNAEQLNRMGERARKAGIELAYHNHNFEFRRYEGAAAYDRLLAWTDPELVKMELDCAGRGWRERIRPRISTAIAAVSGSYTSAISKPDSRLRRSSG